MLIVNPTWKKIRETPPRAKMKIAKKKQSSVQDWVGYVHVIRPPDRNRKHGKEKAKINYPITYCF
jgi:hypothetical protein